MDTFDAHDVSLLVEDYLKRESLINTHTALLNESPWLKCREPINSHKKLSHNLYDLLRDYARQKDEEKKYKILFGTMEEVCYMLERTRYKLHKFNSTRQPKFRHKRPKCYINNSNSISDSSDHSEISNRHFLKATSISDNHMSSKTLSLNPILPHFSNVSFSSHNETTSPLNSHLKHQLDIINSPSTNKVESAKFITCNLNNDQIHSPFSMSATTYQNILQTTISTGMVPFYTIDASINCINSLPSTNICSSDSTKSNDIITSSSQNFAVTHKETLAPTAHAQLSPSKKKFSEQETIQNLIALLGISPERRIKWPNLIQNLIEDTKFQKALADVINNNLHTSPNFKELNISENLNSSTLPTTANVCSQLLTSSSSNVINPSIVSTNKRKRKKTVSNEYASSLNCSKNYSENLDESLNKSLPLNNDVLTDILEMIEIGPEFEPLFNIFTDKKDCVNDDVAHLTPFLTFDVDEIYENSSFWNQPNDSITKSQDSNVHCHDNTFQRNELVTPTSQHQENNLVRNEKVLQPSVSSSKVMDSVEKISNLENDHRPVASLLTAVNSNGNQQTESLILVNVESSINEEEPVKANPAPASSEDNSLSTTLNPSYLRSLGLTPLTFSQDQREVPQLIDLENENMPNGNSVTLGVPATSTTLTEDQLNAMIRARLKGMRQILPKQKEVSSPPSMAKGKKARSKKTETGKEMAATTTSRVLYDTPEKEVAHVLASLSTRNEQREGVTCLGSSFKNLQSVAAQSLLSLTQPDTLAESAPNLSTNSLVVSNGRGDVKRRRHGKSKPERSPILTRKGRSSAGDKHSSPNHVSTSIVKSHFLNTLYTKLTDQGLKVKKISTADGNNTTLMVDPKEPSPVLLSAGSNNVETAVAVAPHNLDQLEVSSDKKDQFVPANLKQTISMIRDLVKEEDKRNEAETQCSVVNLTSKSEDTGCRHKKRFKFKSVGGEHDVQAFLAKVYQEKIVNNPKIDP